MNYLYGRIKQSERIPDAYEKWSGYRTELTGYVLERLGENKRIAILGAGACNDISLASLLKAGHEITLLDCDEVAMEDGVIRQLSNVLDRDKVSCRKVNVWDVTVQEYHTLEELFFQRKPMKSVISHLNKITERIVSQPVELLGEEYDMMVCVGFHSQVTVMFISLLQYYMSLYNVGYSREDVDDYQKMLYQMNVCMAERVQEWMKQSTKRMILGYEYGSFDAADDRIYEIKELFQKGRADLVAQMGISRVQGAVQLEQYLGIQLAQNRMHLCNWGYLVWNILPEKNYLMVLYDVILGA